MFQEHEFTVWGAECECGREVAVLQNKAHPWLESELVIKAKCPGCGQSISIDQARASEFYSKKILSYYSDISGAVLDLGCGEGFLSAYLAAREQVDAVWAIDCDPDCEKTVGQIADPKGKIRFQAIDAREIGERFGPGSVDYLVHRDVFMFVADASRYFDDVTRIVKRGIRHMGWFMTGNARMQNQMHPDEIVGELRRRGWNAEIEYLDWYKCGYYIRADRA